MASQAGTLETIAAAIGRVLATLETRITAREVEALGLRLPPVLTSDAQVVNAAEALGSAAAAMPPVLQQLADAIAAENEAAIVAAGLQLVTQISDTIEALDRMSTTLATRAGAVGGLSPAEQAQLQTFAQELATRALEYLLVDQLQTQIPALAQILMLLGIVEVENVAGGADGPLSTPTVRKRLHITRLVDLVQDPAAYLQTIYGWGRPDFDTAKVYAVVERLLKEFDLLVETFTLGGEPTLEAILFSLQRNTTTSPPALNFELRIPATADVETTLLSQPPVSVQLKVGGRFDAGGSGTITPPFSITFNPPSAAAGLDLLLNFIAADANEPLLLLGQTQGNRLTAARISAGLGLTATLDSTGAMSGEPLLDAGIEGGLIFIDLSQGDGFIQNILSGVRVESNFDLKGRWQPSTGLEFQGSGGVEIAIPTHVDLAIIKVETLYVVLGLAGDAPVTIELSAALAATLGPLAAAVDRIGAEVFISFPDDQKGNLGLINLDFGFKPPAGVGLSLDAGAVKGGGYLFFDPERGEYAGVLELDLSGIVAVKAIGLITTRLPDGSQGFSLLIIITAEFGTGIQLGLGFTLLGVGGLLGLNRTMRLQPLAEGIRTGAINSIMFPSNVVANAPRILSDLRTYFPPQANIFLIGPMVKFGWGTPTLVSLSMGVIIEIPGNIAIVGVLKVALPDEDAALLILQVAFIGAIEFDKERAWFFATLFESRVLYMTLEGSMGVLVAWGANANFVVSVGGFHPQFNPPPLPFPGLDRVTINILNTPAARIRVLGYFAVTSNTVQFGAHAELFFGFDEIRIEGHIGFDALMQFSPFYFIIQISASVSVKVFGVGLFSVRLRLSLEGPTPWRAQGTGSISLLFFEISADFDITWGEERDTMLPPIEVMPLLAAELEKIQNWTADIPSSSNLLVSLRQLEAGGDELVLHPIGQLRVSQRAVPLDLTIDKVGNQKPSDAKKFTLHVSGSGLDKSGEASESFAMAQFQNLDDATKLSRPAYEPLPGGLLLSAAGSQLASSKLVKRNVRYETVIIDTNYKRFVQRFFTFWSALFVHFLRGSAVTKSELSYHHKQHFQPFAEKIEVTANTYTVASNIDNRPFDAAASVSFSSEAMAREYMRQQVTADPNLASRLHVIPEYEVNRSS